MCNCNREGYREQPMARWISHLQNRGKGQTRWKSCLGSGKKTSYKHMFYIFLFINIFKNREIKPWLQEVEMVSLEFRSARAAIGSLFRSSSRRAFLYEWRCATLTVIIMSLIIMITWLSWCHDYQLHVNIFLLFCCILHLHSLQKI